MVEPGLGQAILSTNVTDSKGTPHWFFKLGDVALSVSPSPIIKDTKNKFVQFGDEPGRPTMPVYALTDAGSAIASILRDDKAGSMETLFVGMHTALSSGSVRRYRGRTDGEGYEMVGQLIANGS